VYTTEKTVNSGVRMYFGEEGKSRALEIEEAEAWFIAHTLRRMRSAIKGDCAKYFSDEFLDGVPFEHEFLRPQVDRGYFLKRISAIPTAVKRCVAEIETLRQQNGESFQGVLGMMFECTRAAAAYVTLVEVDHKTK
jgi:hypothetical protein